MLTSLGKFLRKLRIDKGELLKDMADKLAVTSSFLSAVENGKKHMPSSWIQTICQSYCLTDEEVDEFTSAVAESEDRVEMNLANASLSQKTLAVSFARKLTDFDEREIKKLNKYLRDAKDDRKI